MRRADRLFQIIQILRRSTRPMTAEAIAGELEVSKRTVYRDMADLIGQRVPIEGEAGFGYVLGADFDMPPLMLTVDEIEAMVLGAQWVRQQPDKALARAAEDVLAKVAAAIPAPMRPLISAPSVGVKPRATAPEEWVDAAKLRRAIRDGFKLRLHYRSQASDETERTVWPVMFGYDEGTGLLVAWCELRGGFRHFRVDRLIEARVLEEKIGIRRAELLARWRSWREAQASRRTAGVPLAKERAPGP